MENFSENNKPKRGRPRLLDPGWEQEMKKIFPRLSHRSVQNEFYAMEAFPLYKNPEFAWLFEMASNGSYKRKTLQYELGRIDDEAQRIEAARWLCEERPTVKVGVAILRRWRKALQGKDWQSKSDVLQLCKEIARLLDNFCLRYPGTSREMIRDALEFCKPSEDDD